MAKLILGKRGRAIFSMGDDLVTQTCAVLARRGAGKTYTASVMAEEMLGINRQVVIIDPLDAWWGLRSSASGKKAGFNVVVFGDTKRHADLPLTEAMASQIADLVAERPNLSCVLSLRHLRKNAQRRFVTDFAEQLFHRKGDPELATAVHVMIDEADLFAPQRVFKGGERMLGAMEDLVRRGRQAGIGITMISQRPQSLNKEVLAQVEVLIVGQITGPHDKAAIRKWIEENADDDRQSDFMKSLAKLKIGEFWFWSPSWLGDLFRVQVRERRTFDSSATPKPGKAAKAPKKLAPVDLKKIRKQLESVLEKAEENDPRKLKKKVAELTAQLKKKAPPVQVPQEPQLDVKAIEKAIAEAIKKRDQEWDRQLDTYYDNIKKKMHEIADDIGTFAVVPPREHIFIPLPDLPSPAKSPPKAALKLAGRVAPPSDDTQLTKCQRAILTVLVQRGFPCTRTLIGIQAGYSVKSGGYSQALADLRKALMITGPADAMVITLTGHAAVGSVDELPTGRELLAYWVRRLPRCPGQILALLGDLFPDGLSRLMVADRTRYSPSSGGFSQALADLRKLELITGSTDNIALNGELFE